MASEVDSEDEESRAKQKRCVTKKNAKVVAKTLKRAAGVDFGRVQERGTVASRTSEIILQQRGIFQLIAS